MGSWGSCDFSQLRQLQRQIQALPRDQDRFCKECANVLSQWFLGEVKLRTPVGDYTGKDYTCKVRKGEKRAHKGSRSKGSVGGELRRNWTANIRKEGDEYVIEIINSTPYAEYVEYGHRTRGHTGWVPGHLMMTIAAREIEEQAPAILARKLSDLLRRALNAE